MPTSFSKRHKPARAAIRVLVYSGDPGGAEAVAPVLACLGPNFSPRVWAKASARSVFRAWGALPRNCTTWSWEQLREAWAAWAPAGVLMSASSLPQKDATELSLRRWAKQNSIPVIAVMDSWQNYAMRFIDPGTGVLSDLPNQLGAPDRASARAMVEAGLPRHIVKVTGHPGLEASGQALRAGRKLNRQSSKSNALKSLVIAHFSQPIRDFWGDSLGYDEFGVAKDIISLIPKLELDLQRPVSLVIKLHPKESRAMFVKMLGRLPANVRVSAAKSDSLTILRDCDVALGMGTIMLVKAVMGDVPALCYAPGAAAAVQNACVVAKRGFIPTLRTATALERALRALATRQGRTKHLARQRGFGGHIGAAKNVFALLERAVHEAK